MQRRSLFKYKERLTVGILRSRGCHNITIQGGVEGRIDSCRQIGIFLDEDLPVHICSMFKQELVPRSCHRDRPSIERLDVGIPRNRRITQQIQRIDEGIAINDPLAAIGNFSFEPRHIAMIRRRLQLNALNRIAINRVILISTPRSDGTLTMQAKIHISINVLPALIGIARFIRRLKHDITVQNSRMLAVRVNVHR